MTKEKESKGTELPFGHEEGEVKGPAPEEWGDDADRPPADPDIPGRMLEGMVGDDGEEVKGPDPKQHPNSAR
jgi:hypothetical protein